MAAMKRPCASSITNLEIMLVQSPARTLQGIADEVITEKSVISGHLELDAAGLPVPQRGLAEESRCVGGMGRGLVRPSAPSR